MDEETTAPNGTLRVAATPPVGRVVLDRPPVNAITSATLADLEWALERVEGLSALVVAGAGRAFSSGADLSEALADATPEEAAALSRRGQRVFGRLEAADLVVVAGIDGYCLGGGMELAACADLRVASPDSTFGQPEAELGLLPGWGGTQRLPHLIGGARAREVILTADRYDAATMADYGFVTELAEDAESRASERARELADGAPLAQRYAKRALLAGRADDAGLDVEATAFGRLVDTDDFAEGLAAFEADRDPEFEGR